MNGANHSPCPAPFLYQNYSFSLIDERMKKRRTEAAAERALPNGETGNV
jgi:hypothetical protein